ncbi:hypothetical protein QQS45_12625 [Alteriqipengyuania flavescens]|nr:hypothetical protein [Alteriqipengyuania flavescens]WJY18443.1 hypothetical protein QQW98_12620 [Alteriqipengyuania flavescens]WJY24384.1 hypothetical protein QQS45_12625 [Alteriqipengyuania flavescens]
MKVPEKSQEICDGSFSRGFAVTTQENPEVSSTVWEHEGAETVGAMKAVS